ncbi:MAG: protease complex subunit PrcB family protein [bacterium]
MKSQFAYKSIIIAFIIVIISITIKKMNQDTNYLKPDIKPIVNADRSPTIQTINDTDKPIHSQPESTEAASLPSEITPTAPQSDRDKYPPINPIYTREWKGSYCGLTKAYQTIIRDAENWENIWTVFTRDRPRRVLIPQIDFSKNSVVVLCMGSQQSSGYSIHIDSVEKTDDSITVYYTETRPNPDNQQSAPLPSQPYHLKVIPYTAAHIQFKKI